MDSALGSSSAGAASGRSLASAHAGLLEPVPEVAVGQTIRHYENTPARGAAEERRLDDKAQTRRPHGSGRPTAYDDAHTGDRFS